MTNFAKIVITTKDNVIKELPVMPKTIAMAECIAIAMNSNNITIKIVEAKEEEFDVKKLNTYIDERMNEFGLLKENDVEIESHVQN